MQILDGKTAREAYTGKLIEKVKALSITPCLVIIQVGQRSDSFVYLMAKKFFAREIGVKEIHVRLDEEASQTEVLEQVEKYNKDKTIQGIIIQLPLPSHLDADTIINCIDPDKDTDGLTPTTQYIAATARGIRDLFKFYNVKLQGKKVTVVGQSKLVGKPIAEMCRKEGAIVMVCDSKTENLAERTKIADILIVAIGKPNFIDEKYISKGQIVIDVGITRQEKQANVGNASVLVGDVDFEKVKHIVSMITPVPGGVGQMTVLALFENLIDACYNKKYE